MVLVLALALVVLVGTWWVQRDGSYEVDRPAPGASAAPAAPAPSPDPARAASRSLGALVGALAAGDPDRARALGADPDAAALLGAVADNAARLQVTDLALRYVDEVGAPVAGAWQAAVELTWRFEGFDDQPVTEEVLVGFRLAGDRALLTSLGGGDRRTPLWWSGPVEVRRAGSTLVLARGTPARADLLASRARDAVPVVRRVLPGWDGRLVLEVPADGAGLDAALGAEPGTYAAVAAVTATVDGSTTPGTPVHVYLNPPVYDTLDPVGAQVVISHEATHVATDAPLHPLPVWLLEGFADYVALRDVDLPLRTTAGQVLARVRADGPPDALPDQADLDPAAPDLGAAYESAWLACTTLVALADERALVRTYTAVSDGGDLADVLPRRAGIDVAELTAAWRARLVDLARQPAA